MHYKVPEGSWRFLKAPEDLKLSISLTEQLTRTSQCLLVNTQIQSSITNINSGSLVRSGPFFLRHWRNDHHCWENLRKSHIGRHWTRSLDRGMDFSDIASGITFCVVTHYLAQRNNRENDLEAGKKDISWLDGCDRFTSLHRYNHSPCNVGLKCPSY